MRKRGGGSLGCGGIYLGYEMMDLGWWDRGVEVCFCLRLGRAVGGFDWLLRLAVGKDEGMFSVSWRKSRVGDEMIVEYLRSYESRINRLHA